MPNINRDDFRYLLDKQDIKVKNYPSEAQVQLSIIKFLRMKGFACGKIKTKPLILNGKFIRDKYLMVGTPDLIIFTPTKMYFCEVKSAKGVLSDDQKFFMELCTRVGITYIIARDIKDVECII